jgi:lipopolysaccharide transport system ATP-binding protein
VTHALVLDRVSKAYHRKRGWARFADEVRGRRNEAELFWALRDISLELKPGGVLGLIGQNGAGKSTLLKLVTGTIRPTSGTIAVGGRIAALLELGVGFHPEFTGLQNIRLNARMLGLPPDRLEQRLPEILDFAGIGEFITQPVRTYSSGMYARLGFSLATHVDADLLIVDETLSVGDVRFSQKAFGRIRQMKEEGRAILFASHDLTGVREISDEAIWIHEGRVRERGSPAEVVREYYTAMEERGETTVEAPTLDEMTFRGDAAQPWRIVGLKYPPAVVAGERMEIEVEIQGSGGNRPPPCVGILFHDRTGREIYGTNTEVEEVPVPAQMPRASVRFGLPALLMPTEITLSPSVHHLGKRPYDYFHWIDAAAVIRILPRRSVNGVGVLDVPVSCEIVGA